jgi:ectoine hydroxylase-related dioxygenase (phytanoyl-CoA dioxygenase family)
MDFDQVQQFDRDGLVLVPDLFTEREVEILLSQVGVNARVQAQTRDMPDADGKSSKLALWTDLGDDVFALVSRSQRVVNGARMLLREDIYHWHSKVMLKEAKVGGAWEWHQDYGYWYGDNCLYPRMISCMIALDAANKENGCLKVIPGSHQIGRINHGGVGKQAGAEIERVAEAEKRLGVHYCEAPAGSALFFHGNLLHSSEPNLSDRHRRAYICTYNAFSNIPFGGKGHGKPEPIPVVPDDAILRWAETNTR